MDPVLKALLTAARPQIEQMARTRWLRLPTADVNHIAKAVGVKAAQVKAINDAFIEFAIVRLEAEIK